MSCGRDRTLSASLKQQYSAIARTSETNAQKACENFLEFKSLHKNSCFLIYVFWWWVMKISHYTVHHNIQRLLNCFSHVVMPPDKLGPGFRLKCKSAHNFVPSVNINVHAMHTVRWLCQIDSTICGQLDQTSWYSWYNFIILSTVGGL